MELQFGCIPRIEIDRYFKPILSSEITGYHG
jgi:hypothetical protein